MLEEIQTYLRENANPAALKASEKFIPTAQKIYGVRMPKLNALVPLCQQGGLELVAVLWKSGAFEEKMLAAKILGKSAKKNPSETFALIRDMVTGIEDWAICDTLAMSGLRSLHKKYQAEIFAMSREFVTHPNLWVRRFGIVALVLFCKYEKYRAEIREIITPLESDKEYYIKKAIVWIKRELQKEPKPW